MKLGLMKEFVKGLDQNSNTLEYLKEFFPKLSEAEVKAVILIEPQTKK